MEATGRLPLFHVVGFTGHRQLVNPAEAASAIREALETLRSEIAGERKFDVWNVNEDAEYHEEARAGALGSERLVPRAVSSERGAAGS